jgi:integrase/recombinase XerD
MRATLLPIRLHEGDLGFEYTPEWQVYDGDGRRKYLDADERQRFLKVADDQPPHVRALCHLLIFSGCRISEALAMRRDHVDVASNAVVLKTLKRRKPVFRRVPLPLAVITLLLEIMPMQGRMWPIHRVTAWRWVGQIMERAGVHGPMACCRGTRHGFAMHAAFRTVPPGVLQRWMGHASLRTTVIYLDAADAEERAFAERMWRST